MYHHFYSLRSAPLLPQVSNDGSSGEKVSHPGVTRLSSVQENGTTYETRYLSVCLSACLPIHSFIHLSSIHLSIYRGYFESERSFSTRSGKFLMCTHTVKGHSSGVLTVYATDLMLFSGSQGNS